MHLVRQINKLKKRILSLGATVEESVQNSITSIENRDAKLAAQVLEHDYIIDREEVDIEEECLHTLALHQPVAMDLRYVVATLKINNELERIGDLAVNISEQAMYLSQYSRLDNIPFDLTGMTQIVKWMLSKSLDSLVNLDVELAQQVKLKDDDVDNIHSDMYQQIEQAIRQDPELVRNYISLLGVSRNLERIADHTVNIAEDVIYMVQGNIIRHGRSKSILD